MAAEVSSATASKSTEQRDGVEKYRTADAVDHVMRDHAFTDGGRFHLAQFKCQGGVWLM